MNKNITCLVLNYNNSKDTIELVKDIQKFEIITNILIVDNKSTDDSLSLFNSKFKENKKVTVIQTKRNGGYGYGNNIGVDYAYHILKSEYVIISNPDVRFSNKLVLNLLKLIKRKNAAVVSGTQKINNVRIKNPAWKIPSAMQWTLIETRFHKFAANKYYYPDNYFKDNYSKVDCVRGAMLMVNASKFLEVGGYDPDMFLFCEETTLGFKLKKKGYSTFILNDSFYDHQHSTSINKSIPSLIRQEKILHRSKLIFMKKYLKIGSLEEKLIKTIFTYRIIKMKTKNKM